MKNQSTVNGKQEWRIPVLEVMQAKKLKTVLVPLMAGMVRLMKAME